MQPSFDDSSTGTERRSASRVALLIRTAKLISPQGEFICIVRDASATGVSVRLFHTLPVGDQFRLELQSGATYELHKVWQEGREAGFEFAEEADLAALVDPNGQFPKRGLRLDICMPIDIETQRDRRRGVVLNLSQQGARMESEALLAIDQAVGLEGLDDRKLRAKVRWRKGLEYGLVFDDTFSLEGFALLAARIQCPGLLREPAG